MTHIINFSGESFDVAGHKLISPASDLWLATSKPFMEKFKTFDEKFYVLSERSPKNLIDKCFFL